MQRAVQQDLYRFLADPASYPHRPESVKVVQTHASYVAIAFPLVYKVKKPVDLGFLDFSTLEKRRHFCEEEVRLNRRLCPEIYEGVVSISHTESGLALEDDEDVVEYAVKMEQLDADFFMHRMLREGRLTRNHIDRIVEKLVPFYQNQAPEPSVAEWGRPEKIRISTDENFEQIEPFVDKLLSRPAFEALKRYQSEFLDKNTGVFERRIADGRILNCHGDLRLGHVHLGPGCVCIYDCIEFNERFRYIDIANDVGFLAMELDSAGHRDLSNYFIHEISKALDDHDLVVLTDFYKSYRAVVRGKVEGMRSEEKEIPEADRQKSRRRSCSRFELGLQYAVAGSEPLVIVVMGRIGTGKSTIANSMASDLGWSAVSSDYIRKEAAGLPLFERPGPDQRARLYTRERTDSTYATMRKEAIRRADRSLGTILDATFGSSRRRAELSRALGERAIPHVFVELTASDRIIRERLQRRPDAEGELSDARLEDFEMLDSRYEVPRPEERIPHLKISTQSDAQITESEILGAMVRRSIRP